MNNALVTMQPNEWQTMMSMAAVLVKSRFLPSAIQSPEQAVTIMMAGRAIGVDAWTALQNINIISGKPTVSPQLMLALIRNSGQLEDIKIDTGANSVTVTMTRKGNAAHSETFGEAEAKGMNLWGKNEWAKQPKNMMKWRAIAACARVVFPDVILGMYTPEEMGDNAATIDTETGEIITRASEPVHNGGMGGALAISSPSDPEPPKIVALNPPTSASPDANHVGPLASNSQSWAVVKRDTLDVYGGNEHHQQGSIENGMADGWLNESMTVSEAIMAIRIHRREVDALKAMFPRVESLYKNPRKDDRLKAFVAHAYRLRTDGKLANIEDANAVVAQVQLDLMGELA